MLIMRESDVMLLSFLVQTTSKCYIYVSIIIESSESIVMFVIMV
jgi:hypothetical protein